MTDSLTSRLRVLIKQGRTPDEAADMALDKTPVRDLKEMVRPLLVFRARRLARENVRAREKTTRLSPATALTQPDAMRALLDSGFSIGTGEWVTWRDATAEQHEQRAQLFRKLADTHSETAARHEQAAEILRNTGSPNLGELYDKGETLKELEPV